MKITAKMTAKGLERTIDFRGSKLPDGRAIEEVLNENESLKLAVKKLEESSSILSKIIPWKGIRDFTEVVLLAFGIIGLIALFI